MREVCLIDTSILCELLRVPGKHTQPAAIEEQFTNLNPDEVALLLPLITVFETGNHIAQAKAVNGQQRRKVAETFVRYVRQALAGLAPWKLISFPDESALATYLADFPDSAMRGMGLGDLSIVHEFHTQCALNPARRVFIWSLDGHLAGYNHYPSGMSNLD